MNRRNVYDVSHRSDGNWGVKERGATRAVGVFENKTEAVNRAVEIAKNQQPAQVVIRKQDGTIQSERTYGNDPFPPKG